MGLPDTVIASRAAVRVVSAMTRPLLLLVKMNPPTMKVLGGVGEEACVGSGMVEVPTTMLEPARDIGVPEIVTAGAPGVRVWPDTTMPDGTGIIVCPVDDVRIGISHLIKHLAKKV